MIAEKLIINWEEQKLGKVFSVNWQTGDINIDAWLWIEFWSYDDYSAMRWPAPKWYHIPLRSEWEWLKTIMDWLSLTTWDNWRINLHMPFAGNRWWYQSPDVNNQWSNGYYWSVSPYFDWESQKVNLLYLGSSITWVRADYRFDISDSCTIRWFKDLYVTPDQSWTVVQWTLWSAWIFWNQSLWLISITDGNTWYTIMDKNLWATTVYNDWDTLTQDNMWNMYQWWNNYWFPSTWTISKTSSTDVDTSGYWPWNYYSSDIYNIWSSYWSSNINNNLRWWETWVVTLKNAINNIWVLSVNWQTWDVTIDAWEASSITTTQPSNPVEWDVYYDTTNDVVKVYDWTNWNEVGWWWDMSNYIAKDNTTAFTPTWDYNPATKKYVDDSVVEYNAWEWISIGDVTINWRKWPSPDGFHVPSIDEWQWLKTIMTSLSLTTWANWRINLHMPFVGTRVNSNASISRQGTDGNYWSSSAFSSNSNAYDLYLSSSNARTDANSGRAFGFPVRCFKDSYVTPDSTWTVVQGTLGSAWIFWNQSDGLISITNGTTGYTMMDKNLWATTVYNDWDTLTQKNMWNMYQWWNNYWFPSTWTISNTSSTQVDASSYWPTNPYSSDTFITISSNDWSSVANDDLWWDTTGTYTLDNAISNTGVLSVNGQTWDVAVREYNAGEWIEIWTYDDYSAMRWPAPSGFHVPLYTEWQAIYNIWTALWGWSADWSNFWIALKLPFAGYRSWYASVNGQGANGHYWSSSRDSANNAYEIIFSSTNINPKNSSSLTRAHSVRCFKNSPTVPTSSWTKLYWTSIESWWIFWSSSDWLISLSSDWQTWITIQDKNLWATTVWNNWDTVSETNCGWYFQWGNNYMFPFTWSITTSSTQVDASNYWPWNYYNSNTYISKNPRDSSENVNLRWWVTWVVQLDNAISNTGVLSVNGKTWDVTVKEYNAGEWIEMW